MGVYLLGVGYGAHEVTNYLHARFCADGAGDLCRIVAFNDDAFSHWVFFTGFVLVNVALLLVQDLFPAQQPPGRADSLLLVANGVFIGLGVFANLACEAIGLDLYIVALLAAFSAALFWRRGRQPLTIYYLTAYSLGPGRHCALSDSRPVGLPASPARLRPGVNGRPAGHDAAPAEAGPAPAWLRPIPSRRTRPRQTRARSPGCRRQRPAPPSGR